MTGIFLSILLILLCATPAAGGELPGRLEDVRTETLHRLQILYRMERELVDEPMEITFANPGEEQYESWRGIPEFAAGAAHGASGRIIVVPARTGDYPFGDEAQTLRHELSHVLLYRALDYAPPRWFDEGLAMRAAGEWGIRDEWLMIFALPGAARGEYPLSRLESDFREGESRVRRSYALARAFVGDMFRDDLELSDFITSARALGSMEEAFHRRYASTPAVAFQQWARDRPAWREWAVVLGSSRTTWALALLIFLLSSLFALIRRRRLYRRLPE